MTIHLTEEHRRFVDDVVRLGLYSDEEDVIRDALERLKEVVSPARKMAVEGVGPGNAPVSDDEFMLRLFAAGLITRLPDPAEDIDDDEEPPIEIEGEPLSETIIRERR